jgi:signal transduction histidine kinase
LLWPAGIVLGLAAEWRLYGWNAPRSWIPDLLVGWTLIGCGLVGWSRRSESWSGPLLAAAGFMWFVPNIAVGWSAWLAAHTLYLHRGPLVQLALTYPQGRPRGRVLCLVLAAAWLVGVTTLWGSALWTVATAVALLGFACGRWRSSVGLERRLRARAVRSTVALGALLVATATVRLAVPTAAGQEATLLFYEAGLGAFALATLFGLLRQPAEMAAVSDLLVDLTDRPSPALRDSFARALGDPKIKLLFWIPAQQVYRDESGRPFDPAVAGSPRSLTSIERDGEPVALLVHDGSLGDDPLLVESIAKAAGLSAANARLQYELRAQLDEVAASRRRLLVAADEERSRLATRLQQGPARQLQGVLEALDRVGGDSPTTPTLLRVERARAQLVHALDELHELAAGLHPRAVIDAGLTTALKRLAESAVVPVRVEVAGGNLSEEIEVAIYFLCSEALANVAKHAEATRASITVAGAAAAVEIVVEDDGRGGANPAPGSGLAGLRDRVETLAGVFAIDSSADRGTRLRVVIPRRGSAVGHEPAVEVAADA